MRPAYGRSPPQATSYSRHTSQARQSAGQVTGKQTTKSVSPADCFNGGRIYFRQLAAMAYPQKTEASLTFSANVDKRTTERWLAGDTEPPAWALSIVMAEILRRFNQR